MSCLKHPLAQGGHALAELPAAVLARPLVADDAPAGAWLRVPDLAQLRPELARALRTRGLRLGLPDGPPADAPEADFVWLRAHGDIDTLLLSAQRWQEARPACRAWPPDWPRSTMSNACCRPVSCWQVAGSTRVAQRPTGQ